MEENLRDRLARLLERFGGLRVAVVGDVMLDSYLHGAAGRICREAPVPVVTLEQRTDVPGGAANAAANVRALGAEVALLAVIGDDSEGALLRQALAGCGVGDERLIVAPGRATLVKHRVLADTQMLVRFDQGSTGAVEPHVEREVIDRLAALFEASDAVIVSDYGYGVLTPGVIAAIAELQRRHRRVLAVDSKQLDAYREAGVTLAKPNYDEALALLGEGAARTVSRVETIAAHGELLRARTGARCVAVTMDLDGALLFSGDAPPYRTFAQRTSSAHPAGAGDTFISAMTLGLASGAELPLAAELAAAASAVVVASAGTVACEQGALLEYLGGREQDMADLPALVERVERHRQQGKRIVFTNGCFDILHRGHITYLNRAKELGDVLIVGVNSDESIRRLKGSGRPINTLDDRMQVLAALSCIDHLVAFGDDTPCELIRAICPDIFVKGGDYTVEQLVEAPLVESLGGEVRILPYVADRSTTRVIARIRESAGGELAREVGA